MSDAISKLQRYDLLGEYDPLMLPCDDGDYVRYDDVVEALQSWEPVVPPQWRVVMRGMIEYAECNDPGNPYLPQAQALLSAGKGGE